MGISKHRSCPSEWSFVRSCAGFTTGTGVELNFNHVLWDFDTGFWPGCDTAFGMEIEWTRLDRRWVQKKTGLEKLPVEKLRFFACLFLSTYWIAWNLGADMVFNGKMLFVCVWFETEIELCFDVNMKLQSGLVPGKCFDVSSFDGTYQRKDN